MSQDTHFETQTTYRQFQPEQTLFTGPFCPQLLENGIVFLKILEILIVLPLSKRTLIAPYNVLPNTTITAQESRKYFMQGYAQIAAS